MTGYQIRIKDRHETKIMKFQINYVTNFVAAEQVVLRIRNKFFDSGLK
jgi:hypothetical protein